MIYTLLNGAYLSADEFPNLLPKYTNSTNTHSQSVYENFASRCSLPMHSNCVEFCTCFLNITYSSQALQVNK